MSGAIMESFYILTTGNIIIFLEGRVVQRENNIIPIRVLPSNVEKMYEGLINESVMITLYYKESRHVP